MEALELDILLDELETRVERLRSLYEQYFLGIEKIPPAIAQKDVDRRLYALRREQIRNTARRFKLQTIVQRYNTFQQYWMRIMREIENGTYRRHVLRAERTVGVSNLLTPGERKRLGLPERRAEEPQGQPPPASGSERPASTKEDVSALTAVDETKSNSSAFPNSLSAHAVRVQMEKDLGRLLDDELDSLDTRGLFGLGNELDDPLISSMPPPPQARRPSAKPVARRSVRPSATTHGRLPPPARLPESTPEAPPPSSSQPLRRTLRPSRIGNQAGAPTIAGGLKLPASSAVAGRGLPPMPKPSAPRGAPPKIPSSPIIAVESANLSPSAVPSRADPKPAAPPLPASSETSNGIRGLPHPSESVIPRPSRPPPRSGETADKPVLPVNVKPPSPARSTETRPNPPAAAPLDRVRIEQLAEKMRDARKQTHETSAVSVDALAKKLEITAEELRKKHPGKRVDFDVVIKDGKAIVKPIVR